MSISKLIAKFKKWSDRHWIRPLVLVPEERPITQFVMDVWYDQTSRIDPSPDLKRSELLTLMIKGKWTNVRYVQSGCITLYRKTYLDHGIWYVRTEERVGEALPVITVEQLRGEVLRDWLRG